MNLNEANLSKYYPCYIDYIVKEKGELYIVYGWKQIMFPLNKIPPAEKAII